MTIRNAIEKDFSEIMKIYSHARKFMAENGNPNQWSKNNWSPENLIHQDILQKKSYVCVENEKIVGTFFIILVKILSRLIKKFLKANGKIFQLMA